MLFLKKHKNTQNVPQKVHVWVWQPIILNHCKPLTTIVVLFKFLYLSFEPSQPGDLVIVKSNLTILRELGMWK